MPFSYKYEIVDALVKYHNYKRSKLNCLSKRQLIAIWYKL